MRAVKSKKCVNGLVGSSVNGLQTNGTAQTEEVLRFLTIQAENISK